MSQKCPKCSITSLDDKAKNCKYCGGAYDQNSIYSQASQNKVLKDDDIIDLNNKNNIQQANAIDNSIKFPYQKPEESKILSSKNDSSGKWKVLTLTCFVSILCAFGVIGFQSFQLQNKSNKIDDLERKYITYQKNVDDSATLTMKNQELTEELEKIKLELEQKTKSLSDIQTKAVSQQDEVKTKDDKLTKLESENKKLTADSKAMVVENKNLVTKNSNLASENETLKEKTDNIKNTINSIFAPNRR